MTCPASSLTAPVWRACDCALCCFSSQSFARANETGSRGAGLSDEWDGRFLSAVQRSLYCWSRVLTDAYPATLGHRVPQLLPDS